MTTRQSGKLSYSRALASAFRRGSCLVALVGLLVQLPGPGHVAAANAADIHDATAFFPAWFKQSFLDLRQDLAEAGAAGKQGIMVLFHIHGCPYCKMLVERSLKDPAIEASLRRHFDVIHLDIHSQLDIKDPQGRSTTIREFAAREGASFSPTVAFYGLGGQALTRVVGYQTPERFRATLAQAIDSPRQGGIPPHAGARANGKIRPD